MSTEQQTEDAGHSSKKRSAAGQLTRDNSGLDDDDAPNAEMGTFKRASDEVIATRRFVKVRRNQPASSSTKPSSNPFAQLSFQVQSSSSSEIKTPTLPVDKTTEKPETDATANIEGETGETEENGRAEVEEENRDPNEEEIQPENPEMKNEEENGESKAEAAPVVERNASEIKGEAESKQENGQPEVKVNETAEENPNQKDEEAQPKDTDKENEAENGESEPNPTVERIDSEIEEAESKEENKESKPQSQPALSSFGQLSSGQNAFSGLAKGGSGFSGSSFSGSVFNLTGGTTTTTNLFSAAPPGTGGGTTTTLSEVVVETGEEDEIPVFAADAILFEFIGGGWKERGKGELKVNISGAPDSNKSRLVMRARGNLRLILNASLYPDMSLTAMEKRGVSFTCINSAGRAVEGKAAGLAMFALKFKDAGILEEFREAVETNKGQKLPAASSDKMPENSPKEPSSE